MCDQTEVSYLEDDVVWVKIGPIWWPGVVKDLEKDDEGKEILASLKKKPIAAVKFFKEENYEFVKNLDHIYHYNCRKKDEFIKKGLDKFRTGASHMKKFPADVTTAESLTNGDVNIINDPKFYPEKKESYSEIFGSGKKKNKKDCESSPKAKGQSSAKVTPYRPITHQRFINKVLSGESDHKVKTLIQCNSGSDDGVSRNPYKCHICKFETSRVNVIVAHHRLLHSTKNSVNWTGSDSKLIRRKPVYKSRKIKCKKLFDNSRENDFESDEEEIEKKKSPKSKSLKEKAKTPEKGKNESSVTSPPKRKSKEDLANISETKKKRFTDVLLADWDEDEEDDKKNSDSEEKKENDEESSEKKDESTSESVEQSEKPDSPKPMKNQNEKMSCFDFDEEEEGFIGMSNANTYGRKIPRVIPVKDKTELGMDLEIEELFKRKSESESESCLDKTENQNAESEDEKKISEDVSEEAKEADNKETSTPAKGPGRRRRSKASKEEDPKVNSEDSLAMRRARRPGAKKSYLNEVIEKVDEDSKSENDNKTAEKIETEEKVEPKPVKEETGSSSRRKQDFKHHTLDSDREEIVYSEIVSNDHKTKPEAEKKKGKTQNKDRHKGHTEDLTLQIDSLLEETKPSSLPEMADAVTERGEKSDELKSTNFSFDFVPSEQIGKKSAKNQKEMKSINRMFSDSVPNSGNSSEVAEESQSETQATDSKDTLEERVSADGQMKTLKFSSTNSNNSQKRGSIVLSSMADGSEGSLAKVKVLPVIRQGNGAKDCIVLPSGKKSKTEEESDPNSSETEVTTRPKNIKAIKVKSDSLPPSLITAGKLKGQTIIHQKGGKYVIVTQSPPLGRQKASPGKVQSGSKVVILTNQLGEQKIITASNLQQTKFKVDGQKILADSVSEKEAAPSTSNNGVGQTQPVIKMVPDGKGGIMKQLTVSPKKVLLGGTKVLVSGSGSTFSTGNNVQKITLSGGIGVTRTTGGDFRLIENYKGSGKTVLIQGGSNAGSGVVLKPASGVPRQVTKVIQNSQTVPTLKKKPKILMRASTSQGEFVMQPAESPTFVVKQKGTDGKFSTQKFVRTEIVNQPKASLSGTGTKAFFISGQSANKKGESYIITTNESVPGKVIRMRQKIKEVDASSSKTQKVTPKNSEIYTISQNNLILPNETPSEAEAPQIVQIQEQNQQPVLQTQVIAMPGPVGADGNQTYVLVSVDENGVVQGVDNSVVAYDATAQPESIFMNPTSTNNVILINPQANEEAAPVFSTSSQDILAEALANTNVLEGTINNEMESVVPSILLPPSIPSSVVQETSITLQKPIMTPLEMPSSVTPDTSGLEPPPLPPTPTEEDVLMEESEMPTGVMQELPQKEGDTGTNSAMQTYLESGNFNPQKPAEPSFQLTEFSKEGDQKIFEEGVEENKKMTEYYSESTGGQEVPKEQAQEEYLMENSQEQSHSFQSLPVLNDEPDTSEDVQGTETIPEQTFDVEKSRTESEQFSQLLREQEPPSSTNNEMTETHEEPKFDGTKYETYHESSYESGNGENESKSKEPETKLEEEQCEGPKEKETLGSKESQSLPIIADESNVNSYEMDSIYSDVMSQKRFQEETEVSSTTDEFSNKDVTN